MKELIKKTFLAFPAFASACVCAQNAPNLIFIMADQWRGDALGCIGKEPVRFNLIII